MKRMWLVLIIAASMLTGCVVAGGPPYYDYSGYYGYGHGHEHGGHGYDDEDDD